MQQSLNQFHKIERDLSNYLRPVDPDPGFVRSLSQRLSRLDGTIMDRSSNHRKFFSIVGLGLMVGVILWLLLGERAKV